MQWLTDPRNTSYGMILLFALIPKTTLGLANIPCFMWFGDCFVLTETNALLRGVQELRLCTFQSVEVLSHLTAGFP